MFEFSELSCATDKEIFDLLISRKKKINDSCLRELAKDRGIFYSSRTDRAGLVNSISMLAHDHYNILKITNICYYARRTEKTTSVELPLVVTSDDLKEVLKAYQDETAGSESTKFDYTESSTLKMSVEYNEFDYSKTRLAQRITKEANLEFTLRDDVIIIRFPVNEKAETIVDNICKKIGTKKNEKIIVERIEVSNLINPEDRISFFINLISSIPGYALETVTEVKVASSQISDNEDNEDDEDLDFENNHNNYNSDTMLSIVTSVILKGQNLAASPQYQRLLEDGFFITSITWISKNKNDPYDMVKFYAAFDNGLKGTGFKYEVNSAPFKNGTYSNRFSAVVGHRRSQLFELIESTARITLRSIYDKINKCKNTIDSGDEQ
jgi:hypothetical protein